MKAIVMISGFTEGRFEHTGTRKIRELLLDRFGDQCQVYLCEWDDDFESLVEELERTGVTEILVGAYSWGCGHGLRKLAGLFGGEVRAVLCDPVFNSDLWVLNWRALTNWFLPPKIKYTPNVTVLAWFSQRLNKPQGHKVKAGKMLVQKPQILPFKHGDIDDSAAYRLTMAGAAKDFLNN